VNKVVCYVCGTSYPENATQCPICGYVQTADSPTSAKSGDGSYTYVKGGRFSKANVKKRNQNNPNTSRTSSHSKQKGYSKPKKKTNALTVILIIVLLLAILSVSAYILLRFFVPNDFMYEGLGNLSFFNEQQETIEPTAEITEAPTQAPTEAETVNLDCTAIQLDTYTVELEELDSTYQLQISLDPAETPDVLECISSDETVAVVTSDGLITAVGEGTATITVNCGSATVQCTVNCNIATAEITLNRNEITFSTEGETWVLYSGDIPTDDIIWTSDDNSVATIEGGKVTAVANGDTTVYAAYNDTTVACVVHCKFEEAQEEDSNITEADGDSDKTYMLHNPYGRSDDVTLNIGEQFILKLVDEGLEEASDAQWTVGNESVCTFSDNTVKAVGSGTTEIVATYGDKTYTCIVRVN